jgi:hypothetical protein
MIVGGRPAYPPALADDLTLYHVVHPSNPELDEWTQDYIRARAFYERFARDYGCAHLHRKIFHAGQYEAECLMHTEPDSGSPATVQ